ncbi:hypothetical protein ARMSODRAFT_623626 [Armillaria solidipes]|uniref:Uncharacterized protein n=1 Tax=Armillaria solidipes TaxID=1076256 RepID=A0A2H3B6P8_9AGAR|nr:hypothetical protein ARMSODRAFT_623626 [Armillaria solidipes]
MQDRAFMLGLRKIFIIRDALTLLVYAVILVQSMKTLPAPFVFANAGIPSFSFHSDRVGDHNLFLALILLRISNEGLGLLASKMLWVPCEACDFPDNAI